MSHTNRRVALLVAALVAALVLAGCGRSQESDDGGGGGDAAQGNTEAPQGVTDDTIKIGASMPVTGPIAGAGGALRNGLQIAVESVNADGGINGRMVDATILDDQYATPRQVSNFRNLVSREKVYAIVDPVGSQLIPASWDYLEQSGIPVWGPISPADPKLENVFRLGASIYDQTYVSLQHLIEEGHKRIGIIYLQGDFGDEEKDAVEDLLAEHPDVEIVSEQSIAVDDLNVGAYVINAQREDSDAYFLGASNTQSLLMLQEASERDWKPAFYGNGNTVTTPEISELPFAEGIVSTAITQPIGAETDGMKKFREDAEKYSKDEPTLQTAEAYANAIVFFEALRQAGDDLSWEGFIGTAESLENYETGIYPTVSFGALPDGHHAARSALLTRLEDGGFVQISDDFVEPGGAE